GSGVRDPDLRAPAAFQGLLHVIDGAAVPPRVADRPHRHRRPSTDTRRTEHRGRTQGSPDR
ncbi:hypothetical protein ACT3TZ_15225, partial [Brachybacterium sp. AOP25-B2-12]|uniref:hypothetical protein n=1 Tax=Brachybacterium sp. AOP25-B2-12 TaxID=3457710 RepID=UPI004033AE4D